MIAVIADDLTGAAELGGIALRHGLTSEVQTEFHPTDEAEVIVIDTDSRSCPPEEAAARIRAQAQELTSIGFDWLYKKVDSVLRGPVVAELEALLAASGRQKALLVPANPSLGRTIRNGCYFIDGRLLHETDFANDPEYPRTSSDVLDILGTAESVDLHRCDCAQTSLRDGISIGDATCRKDLLELAQRVDDRTVPAGGADFFSALLEMKGSPLRTSYGGDDSFRTGAALFVSGSSSQYSRTAIDAARTSGVPVCHMPDGLLAGDDGTDELLSTWVDDTAGAFEKHSQVIMAVAQPVVQSPDLALKLSRYLSIAVENTLNQVSVEDIYIEGGGTASTIVRRLGWARFAPCRELSHGVVRTRVRMRPNLFLTIKPGSYLWPEGIWDFARCT
jgi:uncharacterized protein YgbK (DUF1537 family)